MFKIKARVGYKNRPMAGCAKMLKGHCPDILLNHY